MLLEVDSRAPDASWLLIRNRRVAGARRVADLEAKRMTHEKALV